MINAIIKNLVSLIVSPSFYSTNQYMLGIVNKKMGNKEEAKKWFEKLIKFDVIKEEDTEVCVCVCVCVCML